MPTIIDGSGSATFQTPLPLAQGGNENTTGNVVSSQVAGAFNATGSAPLFACRAWVNFNGTGVVAIRASGNVSSITDNGTGDYTVNFTTAMQDANYTANISHGFNGLPNNSQNNTVPFQRTTETGSFRLVVVDSTTDAATDAAAVMVSVFR